MLLAIGAGYVAYTQFSGPPEPPFILEDGYRLLYNEDNLDGWRVIGGEATFEADGDEIIGRRGPGDNTFLRTDETFADFSLKMQVRWEEQGNSGVLFRAQQRDGDGRAYGYQYELDPSERAWTGGVYDEARRGWLANLQDNEAARNAVKLDGWNDVELQVRGASMKTWINGVPAADMVDGLDAEGFIALQVHAGKTGVIRWRRIRLKEVPPMSEPGDSLLSAEEWRMDEGTSLAIDGSSLAVSPPGGGGAISTRRRLSDALVQMDVPACDEPTTVRMRFRQEEAARGSYFAEVKIYADRAEGRLVVPGGEQVIEPVELEKADRHTFTGVTLDGHVVLSVGERDALRLTDSGLYERGRLVVQPANCAGDTAIGNLAWYSLRETGGEPLFYQTLETPPAPVLSPEEALGAFRIAPGFEIELVAAEPLVGEPVAMSWDEYGRLYVVEMRGYMRDAYGTDSEAPVGQVVRLTDDDGDGRMDRSEVFLGELVNPRAVAVVNEGVLIGEPPNLWLCELSTPDSLCDKRRSVGGYATNVDSANVEHMENGLRQGLDNWLYNSKSARSLRLVDGQLQEREGLYRGQWGISHDEWGRWLYNHNSTWIQADFFQAEDIVRPGRREQFAGLGVTLTKEPEVFSVRVNPGVNRAYLDNTLREDGRLYRATGASGLAAYRGDQFPAAYAGDVFVPESAGNVVAQFAMTQDGIALTASQRLYDDPDWGQRDFLASTDERFRPVDAMNGPDGALYIIDMYRGIIQDDHFMTDELREQVFARDLESPLGMGRIWRVRHSEGKPRAPAPELAGASAQDLVALLVSDNGWTRQTAQRLLLSRPGEATPALASLASGDDELAAVHALWSLEGRGELDRELALAVLALPGEQRRIHGLRAARPALELDDLLALAGQWQDESPAVLMPLLFALGDHAGEPAARNAISGILTPALESDYVRQAAIRAVAGRELTFLREYLAGAQPARSGGRQLLVELGGNAYRTLRGDLTSTEPANAELEDLLALAASRTGRGSWQQIALLKGFEKVSRTEGFEAARLVAAPPIFSDTAISETDPLWDARLAGRAAFTWPGDELALGIKPLSPEQMALMAKGEAFYPQCGACHGSDGAGIDGLAPPLKAASWVTGAPEWLGRIILQGMTGPVEAAGVTFNGVMPPHGHLAELDDETLAGLMTYMRRSWGNKADPVTPQVVADIRAASAERNTPWTVAELEQVPFDRGFGRFVGKYTVSFITMTISEQPEGLHLSVPMYGSGVLDQTGDMTFAGSAAGETIKLEFVADASGAINKMLLLRNGEEIPLERKE